MHQQASPKEIFQEYLDYYLTGCMDMAFFQHGADELLYTNLQKKNIKLFPLLFAALTCAADPPSTHRELVVWHQKLKSYAVKLRKIK